MSYVVRIQHHPSRAHLLDRLTPALPGCEVVVDPDPEGPRSAFRTYRACLAPADTDWVVVIQDDAIVADGFADALPAVLDDNPGVLVCLFLAGAPRRSAQAAERAYRRGDRYASLSLASGSDFVPTVATAWPTALAAEFLQWADSELGLNPNDRDDDRWVGRWARHNDVGAVAVVPSMVQHPDDTQSLVKATRKQPRAGRNGFRTAAVWTGSALPR